MTGMVPAWFLFSKKKNLPKPSKISGILLCLITVSTILLAPLPLASAEPTRGALIFGSRSDGAMTNPPNSYHWRKTADELYRQGVTSNAISNYFGDDGYATENHQGYPGSIKANIQSEISDTASQYSLAAAMVDFDHGIGNVRDGNFHYMFEDNTGTYYGAPPISYPNQPENDVYDREIYSDTGGSNPSKYFFTLINTCLSGKVDTWTYTDLQTSIQYPVGQGTGNGVQAMPFAWTHKLVTDQPNTNPPSGYMSRNGYTHPDSGAFAYMGSPYGSAALSQTITGQTIYATWLENFFWYALSFDISINNALDEATLRNYNCVFGSCNLAILEA